MTIRFDSHLMTDEIGALLDVLRLPERKRTTTEERLQAIEDKIAIRELMLAYGYLCDARRWHDLVEHFTEDVERLLGGTLTEHTIGKTELLQRYLAPALTAANEEVTLRDNADVETYGLKHLMVDDVVRLSDDGDEAWAVARTQLVATSESTAGFQRGAHEASHVFQFRRVGGEWKIARFAVFSNAAHNPLFGARAREP